MADTKKPALADDDFGAPAPSPSAADQTLELERLRAELASLKAAQGEVYIPQTSTNEQPAGEDANGNPMFWFKVDLPPCGGTDIKLCGVPFFHGELYKVNVDQLRSLKEIVWRTWAHDAQIKGTNENFYRRPTERRLSGQGR